MSYKIIASTWWTPRLPFVVMGWESLSVGAVAIETHGGKWKAYLGYGQGKDEHRDELMIAQNGVKVSREEAAGMFPDLNIEDFVF